jgi:steroid 5-alpha reductase family enzyme
MPLASIGVGALVIWGMMTALWVVSLILKDSSIVDIFWGVGFVVLNWLYYVMVDGFAARKILLAVLVTVWGLRLAIHLLLRSRGRDEDYRYREMRENHGQRWWWVSYFQVFVLQGIIMLVVSTPLLAAQAAGTPARLTPVDVLGAMLWAVGFFFEAVGDAHLARFKRDPANEGELLTSGVWTYTRHPNYFGDAAQWWAFYLIALAAGGWWSIASPALMTVLLVRVSGVAMLEKSLKTEKPGYAEYMARTNAFIPGLPKRRDAG